MKQNVLCYKDKPIADMSREELIEVIKVLREEYLQAFILSVRSNERTLEMLSLFTIDELEVVK